MSSFSSGDWLAMLRKACNDMVAPEAQPQKQASVLDATRKLRDYNMQLKRSKVKDERTCR